MLNTWMESIQYLEKSSGFEHIDAITALCDTQNCQNDKTPQDVVLESVTTNLDDDSWWKFW